MFKKDKDGDTGGGHPPAGEGHDDMSAPPLKPFSKKGSHVPSKPPGGASSFQADIPRRVASIPSVPRRIERGRIVDAYSKRLFVGRDICLNGEITSCDKLVVEGRVEASLSNARIIEVTPTGTFRGSAHVEEADISGRYEGELIATDKLIVRAGGQISGSIRYGKIVIESGGEISGDMQTLDHTTMDRPATGGGSSESGGG